MTRRVVLAFGVVWLGLARTMGAQTVECDSTSVEVRKLEFVGNTTFRSDDLANGLATTQSSWTRRFFRVIGKRYCLDATTVTQDSLRLILFYRNAGFSDIKVAKEITRRDPRTAEVRFVIREGRPILIDSVAYVGFDSVPQLDRLLRGLPVKAGARFDKSVVLATRDTIARRMRDRGYPLAEVLRSFDTDTARHTATVEYSASTGPRSRIGEVNIRIDAQPGRASRIDPQRVRQVLGLREGQLYNERTLEGVKRGLYLSEAFRHVEVEVDSASLEDKVDSLITVNVRLSEGDTRAARISLGWGNLDCVRTQGSYSDYTFLGALRRLDLTGRLSKVGVGAPFDFASGLCPKEVRRDRFSDTLNYYAGVTLSQASLFGLRTIPTITLYSERRSEFEAYLRDTPIGIIGSIQRGFEGTLPQSYSYQMEYGSTSAFPGLFCAVYNVCELAAQQRLLDRNRLAVAGWTATRNRADDFANPARGSVMRFELRHASRAIGSSRDQQFNRAVFDGAIYRPVLSGSVLVLRLRVGTVIGNRLSVTGSRSFVPPQERLYAGGPNTVRGFRQNELGPVIYDVSKPQQVPVGGDTVFFRASPDSVSVRVVPSGGDNVVIANAELRLRSVFLPDLIQYSIFVDAGEVWNRSGGNTGRQAPVQLKVTPGVGVRVFTPIGPVRIDVGYNPYQAPKGPAYFNDSARLQDIVERPLYCVSPGNTLPVTPGGVTVGDAKRPPVQASGECPASFQPRRLSFLSRLTLAFSIGQAF
ncbi:MAG: BamA/TamA family outer membrane protein [Gemmatimonadaceae bacterium]|nr:BamA/TamA family outer membrane protein [Gemmatimonadaceae bacterium]